jgi:putative tryptophan/tyrosine transport system substrate-binding protein
MHRRRFVALLGAAITAARTLRAQQKAMPVIGALNGGSRPANLGDRLRGPLHQGMREEGFVEGQNMMWEPRWADFHGDRLPALAADLVSRKVDLIITAAGFLPSAVAAKNATSTIPIIFTNVADPVGFGLVASLARPGGNLTGFSDLNVELIPKRLELLCELVPKAAVIAQLMGPNSEVAEQVIRTTQEAARAKDIKVVVLNATTETEIDAAFEQLHADALLVQATPFLFSRRDQLVALAARHAVPAMYFDRSFVVGGGLISYGADTAVLFRQAGIYAGKILKGTNPVDLPVQQPTTFKLVVNLKTAKALGLTVPPSILARADEVIE